MALIKVHFFRYSRVADFCSCKIGIQYILYISPSKYAGSLALIAMDGMYAGFAGAKVCRGKITFF